MLRRLRMSGAQIAFWLALALSTVSAVLLRVGLGKLRGWSRPSLPTVTNGRRAGELLHIDVKKLGRIQGGAGHRVTGKRRGNPTKTHAAGQRECQVGW